MKGLGGKTFTYNFRGVKNFRIWTVDSMDLIIKTKEIKKNNIP